MAVFRGGSLGFVYGLGTPLQRVSFPSVLHLCIRLHPPSVSSTSRYHIPFPVVGRSSFGIWGTFYNYFVHGIHRRLQGSLWPVFNNLVWSASSDWRYTAFARKPKPNASPRNLRPPDDCAGLAFFFHQTLLAHDSAGPLRKRTELDLLFVKVHTGQV